MIKASKLVPILVAGVLAGLSVAANSQSEDWIDVAKTNSTHFDARKGSFERGKTKGGVSIAVVIGRTKTVATNTISFEQWYVSEADCFRGMGKMVTLTSSGKYITENDFISKGGNAASTIADFICSVLAVSIQQDESKGL